MNYLSDSEKLDVLRWTERRWAKMAICGGAYIEGQTGDIVKLYRKHMDAIVALVEFDPVSDEPAARKIFRREGCNVMRQCAGDFARAGL